MLEQSTNYRPYSSSIHAQKGEEKKGEVVNWQKEAKKRKKHARFSRWDAGTRWRPRPRERVRFFSRKNGFSMSVNSVAETAQSRLTRAPRPLENTTRRDGRWIGGRREMEERRRRRFEDEHWLLEGEELHRSVSFSFFSSWFLKDSTWNLENKRTISVVSFS